MKLRDRFWLWGHPEGRYNNNAANFGFFDESRMTPTEACFYLGISNTFMTPVGWTLNKRKYNKAFTPLRNVAWDMGVDLVKEKDKIAVADKYLEDARDFPNVTAAVFDDFKWKDRYKQISLDEFDGIMDRLHNNDVRPVNSWMTLYTHEFGIDKAVDDDFQPYIDVFDGIVMWTWKESDVNLIPEKWEIFKTMAKKRRMFGCYLWNFGESKPATREAVLWQLDFYREKILLGEAEGAVLHTNVMADADLDSFDAAREWMKLHGDEEVVDL
jgi:hypothetical protein